MLVNKIMAAPLHFRGVCEEDLDKVTLMLRFFKPCTQTFFGLSHHRQTTLCVRGLRESINQRLASRGFLAFPRENRGKPSADW